MFDSVEQGWSSRLTHRIVGRAGFGMVVAAVLSVVLAAPASSQGPVPAGNDFLVNTITEFSQQEPSVAASRRGDFTAAWHHDGWLPGNVSGNGLVFRRFSSAGAPLSSDTQVHSSIENNHQGVALGMNPGGTMVAVWTHDWGQYAFARRFDSAGGPLGNDFPLPATNSDDLRFSWTDVDLADSGAFVAAWKRAEPGVEPGDIYVRLFDASGDALTSDILVNTPTDGNQWDPAVAAAPTGAFVVVWVSDASDGTDNDGTSIQGRCYTTLGQPVGEPFQVNTTITGDQRAPDVSVSDSGAFVAVWESESSPGGDNSNMSVQARRYSASCQALGSQFQVNTWTADFQGEASVLVSPIGSFTVAWASTGSWGNDDDWTSIQARSFAADGQPLGDQQQVNTTVPSTQNRPVLAGNPDSRMVVVWDCNDPTSGDPEPRSIRARTFVFRTVFVNAFENGNFSGWSTVVN